MKKLKLKSLVIVICSFVSSSSFSQANWTINGNFNTTSATNFIGTTNNQAFLTRTNNINRMKLNSTISYALNNLPTQNRDGFLLLGRTNNLMDPNTAGNAGFNLYNNTVGAFSLLHLNGEGNLVQQVGYRNWMHTGITLTGNNDLSYFGLRIMNFKKAS